MRRLFLLIPFVFVMCGCTTGEKLVEIDGKPHILRIASFAGIPVKKEYEVVLTPEERQAEREEAQRDFEQRLKQKEQEQKLWRLRFITVLMCIMLGIGAICGLVALVTKKVGTFGTISIAAFVISAGLAIWGNILKWAHSPWVALAIVGAVVVFIVFRKFSAVEKGREVADKTRDQLLGWIEKGKRNE